MDLPTSRGPLPRLAIAFDAPAIEPLEPILDELQGLPVLAKVGLSLFTAVGPSVVHHFRMAGFDVFLDLKLHDIPHQVRLAVAAAARLDIALLTVHSAGGRAMLEAAVAGASGRTKLLGVSVLTSLDERDLRETGVGGDMATVVQRRLELVRLAGLDGAVLSARELPMVADAPAGFLRVVPGIRAQAGGDDQSRVATAADALASGASILVVGRPVLSSPEPRRAAEGLLAEIQRAGSAGA